jgi:hypothetical protein
MAKTGGVVVPRAAIVRDLFDCLPAALWVRILS